MITVLKFDTHPMPYFVTIIMARHASYRLSETVHLAVVTLWGPNTFVLNTTLHRLDLLLEWIGILFVPILNTHLTNFIGCKHESWHGVFCTVTHVFFGVATTNAPARGRCGVRGGMETGVTTPTNATDDTGCHHERCIKPP